MGMWDNRPHYPLPRALVTQAGVPRDLRGYSLLETLLSCWSRMTFRKELLVLLSDQPRSASFLARELGLTRTEIEEDLHHAIRSARAAGHRVQVLPARCKSCGFEFGEDRLTKPGKCPACKGSRIYEAQILLGPAT